MIFIFIFFGRFWVKKTHPDVDEEEIADDVQAPVRVANSKRHKLFFAAVIYLLLGITILMFIPALAFTFIEGWSYPDAIYVSFVTLTTIGFGDLVPGDLHLITLCLFLLDLLHLWAQLDAQV